MQKRLQGREWCGKWKGGGGGNWWEEEGLSTTPRGQQQCTDVEHLINTEEGGGRIGGKKII